MVGEKDSKKKNKKLNNDVTIDDLNKNENIFEETVIKYLKYIDIPELYSTFSFTPKMTINNYNYFDDISKAINGVYRIFSLTNNSDFIEFTFNRRYVEFNSKESCYVIFKLTCVHESQDVNLIIYNNKIITNSKYETLAPKHQYGLIDIEVLNIFKRLTEYERLSTIQLLSSIYEL